MKKCLIVLSILIAVPFTIFCLSAWIEFWLMRPMSQWAALGVGVPFAIMAVIAYLTFPKDHAE